VSGSFARALVLLCRPGSLGLLLLGTIVGLAVGIIPGLGSIQGIVLLLPLTYTMEPAQALILLTAIYCSSVFGGSITAILFRIPGTESSIMTTIDGYELNKKGLAGKAVGTAMICSSLGGIFGVLVLQLLAPQLAQIALKFGPSEYFALCVLGLSCVSSVGTKSQLKAFISALFGLFLATVGIDPVTGVTRFTFGLDILKGGVPFTPAIIGLFAISEILNQIGRPVEERDRSDYSSVKVQLLSWVELLRMRWLILRSAIVGTCVGILPGVGASTAAVIAYNQEKKLAKEPSKWGTGILEGVAAPETSNNASVGGAMVPLLSLGIPGSSTAAVLIGAFLIHGLRPGPLLFMTNPDVVYLIFAGMYLTNIIMALLTFIIVRIVVKILAVPYSVMSSVVIPVCVSGAIVLGGFSNVWTLVVFGLIGYLMSKHDFPLGPVVIALVLGPMLESNLRRALVISESGFLGLLVRPGTAVLLGVAFIYFMAPIVGNWRSSRAEIKPAQ
jgi:putative tricarboxylic transport membrane protein